MRITKEFRDKLMAADHAYLVSREKCSLVFVKNVKVPGFGHTTVQDPQSVDTAEGFPQFDAIYIPQSTLQALFYTVREGDNLVLFADKLEKDRKLYLISAHINRNNKTSTIVLTFPLIAVRGK